LPWQHFGYVAQSYLTLDNTFDVLNYVTAFAVPIVIVGVSGVVKKLVRKQGGFRWDDFYLGMDLTLAAFSAAVVNVLDLTSLTSPRERQIASIDAWYIIVCFVLFVLQLAFHQEWVSENRAADQTFNKGWQIVWLGFASNVIGIGLLGFFMVLKIKGKI
jgi:hypothetical protein